MKAKTNVTIHNRFDIEVTDIRTGKVREYRGFNIVLDQMWTRLCARSAYFANIHYGTGSGTLAASRTSLFTHLGTKTAVDDVLSKALPTSYWRRKIVLNPEDNVGAVLSEVGVAYGATSTYLVSHAMIRDMNNNVVTITKLATDLITIYGTVYVTFSTSDTNLKIVGLPDRNALINYLIGGATFPTCYFYTGEYPDDDGTAVEATVSDPVLGTTAALTWTADAANKRTYSSTPRFAVGDSNGNIAEIGLGGSKVAPISRLLFPATGIYSGLGLEGVSIGTGDGATSKFMLPSRNVDQNSVVIKVDGTATTAFTKELVNKEVNFRKTHCADIPNTQTYSCSLSGDGLVLALTSAAGTYLVTYELVDGLWRKRSLPSVPPGATYTNGSCKLTRDGLVLAVATNATPYFYTYDWTSGAWVKRADPTVAPVGTVTGCALSDDGLVLAISHSNSPYITTYDWTGGAWVKRTNPATLPTGTGKGAGLSGDGLVLAVAHFTTPYITTYDWTGGAWVKRADPATLPTGNGTSCALTADGLVLAVAHGNTPNITTYDWTGGAWVKRADPATPPSTTGNHCALSNDGLVLAFVGTANPYAYVYRWVSGAWVSHTNYPTRTTADANSCALNSDGSMLALSSYYTPFLNIFDLNKMQTQITFTTAPAVGAVITADYTVNGIHKTIQRVIDLQAVITFGEPV